MSQEGKSKGLAAKELWGCIGTVLAGFVAGFFLLFNTVIATWVPRLPFWQAQASPTPVVEIASPSPQSTLGPEVASPTSPPAVSTSTPTLVTLPSPTPSPTLAPSLTPSPSPTPTVAPSPTSTPPPVLEGLGTKLDELNDEGKEIKCVAFTPDGGWTVLYARNGYSTYGLPQEAVDALSSLNDDDEEIKWIAFTPESGWVILFGGSGFWRSGLPQEADDALTDMNERAEEIGLVAFAPHSS